MLTIFAGEQNDVTSCCYVSVLRALAKEADAHVWGAVISDWVLDFSSKPVFEIITEYITKIIQTNYHKQIVSNVLN